MALSSSTTRGMSLFCRIVTTIGAVVVLGITAWAVESTKTVTVIYSLAVACLTALYMLVLAGVSFLAHRKLIFHVISTVMDLFLAFLWIAAFVVLVNTFETRTSCRVHRWNGIVVCSRAHTVEAFAFIAFFFSLLAAIFSLLTVYAMTLENREQERPDREKAAAPGTTADPIPATEPTGYNDV